MAIYNQSTALSGGRFSPSVNYNAAIRMPTQPMPDLPDVNESFNIDLRPIGEAIIASKEMDIRAEMAKAEQEDRWRLAQFQADEDRALKEMELDATMKRHYDDLAIEQYKAETDRLRLSKETSKDSSQALLDNFILRKMREIHANKSKGAYKTNEEFTMSVYGVLDEGQALYPTAKIGSSLDAAKKLYGEDFFGAIGQIYETEKMLVDKTVEDDITSFTNDRSKSATLQNSSPEEAYKIWSGTRKAIKDIEDNTRIINSTYATVEQKEAARSDLNNALGYLGGAELMQEFYDFGTNVRASNNPVENVRNLKNNFRNKLLPVASETDIQLTWDMLDKQYNITKSVTDITKMSTEELQVYDNQIKKIASANKLEYMSNYPTLATLETVNPQLYQHIFDPRTPQGSRLTEALQNVLFGNVNVNGKDYVYGRFNQELLRMSSDDINTIKDATGLSEPETAMWALVFNSGVGAEQMYLNKQITEKDAQQLIANGAKIVSTTDGSPEGLYNTVKNSEEYVKGITPRMFEESCKVNGAQNACTAAKGFAKLSNLKDPIGFIQDVKSLSVGEFLHRYIKGGRIIIAQQPNGITLYRDTSGVAGILGEEQFNTSRERVLTTLNDNGLEPDEQLQTLASIFEASNIEYQVMPKGWQPSPAQLTSKFFQGAIGSATDKAAVLETKVAEKLADAAYGKDFSKLIDEELLNLRIKPVAEKVEGRMHFRIGSQLYKIDDKDVVEVPDDMPIEEVLNKYDKGELKIVQ